MTLYLGSGTYILSFFFFCWYAKWYKYHLLMLGSFQLIWLMQQHASSDSPKIC
jgi:hypothetical protein